MNQKEVLAFVERHGIAFDGFVDAQIGIDA